jgi:hypothetical protein
MLDGKPNIIGRAAVRPNPLVVSQQPVSMHAEAQLASAPASALASGSHHSHPADVVYSIPDSLSRFGSTSSLAQLRGLPVANKADMDMDLLVSPCPRTLGTGAALPKRPPPPTRRIYVAVARDRASASLDDAKHPISAAEAAAAPRDPPPLPRTGHPNLFGNLRRGGPSRRLSGTDPPLAVQP